MCVCIYYINFPLLGATPSIHIFLLVTKFSETFSSSNAKCENMMQVINMWDKNSKFLLIGIAHLASAPVGHETKIRTFHILKERWV